MAEREQTRLTVEGVRYMTREIAGVPLSDAEIEGLLPLLTMLFGDTAAALAFDRSGLEPDIRFVLEEWQP
jgi:hypothetical protein